ncbi:hypothetical protein HHI36_000854 [Cryptolaemus montrouzieri]|uniref:PiggyBac transposable element-derived protein domain-containing protein n=1 Tax=Cryptolaemus montrouzieri TaxID=559131 RepID=A0ABD2P6F4_9CUCU
MVRYLQNPVQFSMTLLQLRVESWQRVFVISQRDWSCLSYFCPIQSFNILLTNQIIITPTSTRRRYELDDAETVQKFESRRIVLLSLTLLMPPTEKLKLQEFWSKDSLIQTPGLGQIMIRPLLDHFASVFKTAFYPFQNIWSISPGIDS